MVGGKILRRHVRAFDGVGQIEEDQSVAGERKVGSEGETKTPQR